MSFKKLCLTAGLIVATFASTAVHADIPGMRGYHYLELNNNTNIGKSIRVAYGDNHVQCFNVNPHNILRSKIIVRNGVVVLYGLYTAQNCTRSSSTAGQYGARQVMGKLDNDPYLHLKF